MVRETSADAYHAIEERGLLSQRRWAIYKWLYHNGPATQSECHKDGFPELQMDSVKPRFAELESRGVIRVVGERKCRVTGVNVTEWDVTANLPTEPKVGVWVHVNDYNSWTVMLNDLADKNDPQRHMKYDVKIVTKRKDGTRLWSLYMREVEK